jgi:predicted HTH domain antitoxin
MRANQFVKESDHSNIDTSDVPLTEMYSEDAIALLKNALATGNVEQWHDLSPGDKLSALKHMYGNNINNVVGSYSPTEEQMDNFVYTMIKKRQDATYQVQIGPEKRAELSKMVEELAEMRRQQARKEKLEDEAIAYQRYQDEQQRQDAFKKIEMQYKQELKVIDTNHRNGMEAIRTGNSHEIQKIELAHGEAERDRDHDLTRLGQQQQHELTMQQQAQRESVERIAELAGVKLSEDLNPNLGKILELANQFAIAVANMKIYTDDLFANYLKSGGLGSLLDGLKKVYTDQSYDSGQREAAKLKQELGKLGVKVDYNESFPTDYTLEIPGQSRPYTFNIIKLLKDAIDGYNSKAVNEDLSRVAELAGVPLKEAWNANMGKIYEAANSMAVAVYDLYILSNPAFRKREDPDGLLYATLQKMDPEDFEDTKELSRRDLADHGAKLTYNANNPRMFTLHVPKMEPYTFDVKEVLVTAVG